MKIGDTVICKYNKRYTIRGCDKFEVGNPYLITDITLDSIYINNYAFSVISFKYSYNFNDFFITLTEHIKNKITKIKDKINGCK